MSVLSETPPAPYPATSGSLLTTGQVGALCAVAPRTVARWADAGLLPSQRTVGGRRRMLRSDVLAFLQDCGMGGLAHRPPHHARIAVVDDDVQVIGALLRMLSRIVPGADVRSAHDGFSAGVLLASFHPDLVLLDIVMPGLSGVEVCQRIKSTPELGGTAVVIVSAHISAEARARLTAVGADGFIPKPFKTADIAAAVADFTATTTASIVSARLR